MEHKDNNKVWVVTLKEMLVNMPMSQINASNIGTVQFTGETVVFTNKEVIRPLTAFAECMDAIKEYMKSSKNVRISIVSASKLAENIDILWAVAYGNEETQKDRLLYAVCKNVEVKREEKEA